MLVGLPVGPDSQLNFPFSFYVTSVDHRTPRVDVRYLHLKPVAGSIVVAGIARGLGHVEESRTRVLDELVVEQLKTDLVACLDVHVGLSGAGNRTLIAPQVVAISN